MAQERLKAPWPYFGGKSRVARLVWARLGAVTNYIEPFCGSAAVLLARPRPFAGVETINDACCYVSNFWRATRHAPELVAEFADGPVNELDLHARHKWLVLSDHAAEFRDRMRKDPWYFDARVAGWWCWGLCCWIGGGWCAEPGRPVHGPAGEQRRPVIAAPHSEGGLGVHRKQHNRRPPIGGSNAKQYGHGVNSGGPLRQKRPRCHGEFGSMPGVHGGGGRPQLADAGNGVNAGTGHSGGGRPQLADAYDVGRGVNSHGELGTCAARRAWLLDWFHQLQDRLRLVRICCGDWRRVCSSESVTTRLGPTGVFLDPPYSREAGRDNTIYAVESGTVAHDVRAWCLERGGDRQMRIVLAGYAGEGHEELEQHGWRVEKWKAQGGYGNRSEEGKANAARERLWCSPHCENEPGLFDQLEGGDAA